MTNKLHLYTIMPLNIAHVDEICEDIRQQYEQGIATCALFSMTLVPEGNPPVDKAAMMCAKYEVFREKLDAMGVPSGVLVQASIGHGWTLGELFPYQRYTAINTGIPNNTVCPTDLGFRDYIYNAMRTIAQHKPSCIMVDDDFRLMTRPTQGCACPNHMRRFNELAGTDLTREEMWEVVTNQENPNFRRYTDCMVQAQKEPIIETARVMRAGIDSVDPTLPGSFCCVGNNAEFADEIAAILAGEGNPVVVRINNGNYTPAGARYFSNVCARAAAQIAKLEGKVDIILAETDTCPQNRYSTGAMSLHTHFVGSILEGTRGAKHWITRLSAHEPQSGKAYRRVLAKYSKFYQALADIVPSLHWRGCRIPVRSEAKFTFIGTSDGMNGWSSCLLERMGIPMYFSAHDGGVVCLDGTTDARMSDEQIRRALSGTVMLASDTAMRLINRGFGEYLGVSVREWKGLTPTSERLAVNGNSVSVQQMRQELVPLSDDVVWDSTVYNSVDKVHLNKLFPGTTVYKNSLGGTVITFCGTPKAEFTHSKGFSFLTYSRKEQLLRLLSATDEMPAYYPGDEEMYFRAADMDNGDLFCALFNIGLDPIDETELVIRDKITGIEKLMHDGSLQAVPYREEDGRCILDTPCYTLNPLVLIIHRA